MIAFGRGAELPRLSGRRLDLCWLTQEDAPAIFSIFGNPEVMRFWSSPPLPDLAAASALIDEIHGLFRTRQLFQWGIRRREDDTVIGTCTLYNLDLAHRRGEIGFALARSCWGQGFASEALDVLLDFCFNRLGLHRLEADADPENVASLRALERKGFQREGYLRERWHHLGEVRDAVFLGLLKREWKRPGSGSGS